MSLKIINQDGTAGILELPEGATLDTKGMGLLGNEEVGAFKVKQREAGKAEALAELEPLKQEKESLMQKLAKYQEGLSEKEKVTVQANEQISQLQKSMDELKQKYEKAEMEKAQATFKNQLRGSVEGLGLVEGAFDILASHVESKKVDGGYMAADGSTVDLSAITQEWSNSALGKALIKSTERGGAGTSPNTLNGESFDAAMKAGKKQEWIAEHGMEAYKKQYIASLKKT
jgi:hypothetical protein